MLTVASYMTTHQPIILISGLFYLNESQVTYVVQSEMQIALTSV